MKNKPKNKKVGKTVSTVIVCLLVLLLMPAAIFLSSFDWHTGSLNFSGGLGSISQSGEGFLKENKKQDWDYFDDTVMVGDSITYGMALYGYLDFNHVFAKIGLHQSTALTSKCVYTSKTQGYSISEALKKAKPGKIIVTLGINAIYSYKTDSFYDNYRALLSKMKKASPDSIIIIQSIFPVTQSWAVNNGKPNCNNYIAYANQRLSELANDEGFYFLYTYEALADEQGFLKSQYSGDGIHLSRKGYEAVFDYILSHPTRSSGEFTKIGAITPPAPQYSTTSKVTMPSIGNISNTSSDNDSSSSIFTSSDYSNSATSPSETQSDISSSDYLQNSTSSSVTDEPNSSSSTSSDPILNTDTPASSQPQQNSSDTDTRRKNQRLS